MIHHSLTEDGKTVSWDAIRKFHMKERGWVDIGYHFGVELIGDRYEILMGRMVDVMGAHTLEMQMNTLSVGICLVGNFDLGPPPLEQARKALELVRYLMRAHGIQKERVFGHREVGLMCGMDWKKKQYKSCPGSEFNMAGFRSLI